MRVSEFNQLSEQVRNIANGGLGPRLARTIGRANSAYLEVPEEERNQLTVPDVSIHSLENIDAFRKIISEFLFPINFQFIGCTFNERTFPFNGFAFQQITFQNCQFPNGIAFKAVRAEHLTFIETICGLRDKTPQRVTFSGQCEITKINLEGLKGLMIIAFLNSHIGFDQFSLFPGARLIFSNSTLLSDLSIEAGTFKSIQSTHTIFKRLNLRGIGSLNNIHFRFCSFLSCEFRDLRCLEKLFFTRFRCPNFKIRNSSSTKKIRLVQSHRDHNNLTTSQKTMAHLDGLGGSAECYCSDLNFDEFYAPKATSLEIKHSKFGLLKLVPRLEDHLETPYKHFKAMQSNFAKLQIRDAKFELLTIKDSELGECEINRSTFQSSTYFRNTRFENAPIFFDTTFHADTSFEGSRFMDFTDSAEGHYRTIKAKMGGLSNEIEESRFASLEMRARWTHLSFSKKDWLEKSLGAAYIALNDFGFSIGKPLIWLFLQFSLFADLYIFGGGTIFNPAITNNALINNTWAADIYGWDKTSQAFYLSFINTLGPLRLAIKPDLIKTTAWYLQLGTFIQGIFSSILLYLFVAGIRKRFKQH
jgi:hypothetical protein